MAIVANTSTTYGIKGQREQLSDAIYNISPEDTPFMSNAGKGTEKGVLFEWQTDQLAAPNTANAVLEGDDITAFPALSPTTRVGNYMQISRKLIVVSGTADSVDKAGRKAELAYQASKASAELKRDMEAIALANQAAVGGSTSVARTTAAFPAWLRSNQVNLGTSGAAPAVPGVVPAGTRTDGSTTPLLTEATFKSLIAQMWAVGADPRLCMVGPVNKARISGFSGIATKTFYTSAAKPAVTIGAADVYVSDFGELSIIANRFQRERDGFIWDKNYVSFQYLRPFQMIPLAKTGDAEKRMMIVEWGLKVNVEGAHGILADLQTT